MMHTKYVPAIGEQFNSMWNRKLEYEGFDMKFFTEKSHFQHDIALQSVYYAKEGVGKSCDINFRDMIKYPKDKKLLFDSGGFQIASFKKKGEVCKLKPIDSLRYQEENCDIGMNLDIPPTLDKFPTFEDFNNALKESFNNFKLFEKERKNYKMWLYNVLHGNNIKLMDIWYNKVKDFNFDGWALSMKPNSNPMSQAIGFIYLLEKGEFDKSQNKGIHFFGTSGRHVVPTLVYAASKVSNRQYVTYDSSSYNMGSIYREYYLPYSIGPNLCFGEKFNIYNKDLKVLPCDCPVCNSIKDINILNTKKIFAGTLISLHNLYQYIIFNKLLNSIVTTKEKFIEYLKSINIDNKTLMSLEFIDYSIDNGLEKGIKKYEKYAVSQELNTKKQMGIFDF